MPQVAVRQISVNNPNLLVTDDDVPLVVEAWILSAYEVSDAGESDTFGAGATLAAVVGAGRSHARKGC